MVGARQSAPFRVTCVWPVCKVSQPFVCKWTQSAVANYVIITPGTQQQSKSHKSNLAHSHNTCLTCSMSYWMFSCTEHMIGACVELVLVQYSVYSSIWVDREFPWGYQAPQCKVQLFFIKPNCIPSLQKAESLLIGAWPCELGMVG